MNPALEFYHFETGDSGPIHIRRSAILSIEYRHDPNSCVLHLDHNIGRHRENHVWINESTEDVITRLEKRFFIRLANCSTCGDLTATVLHPKCPSCQEKESATKLSPQEENIRILDRILPPLPPPQIHHHCPHCGR